MSTDPEWKDAEDRQQIEIDIINGIQEEAKGISAKELMAKCSIYRVPKLMREGNENAYTPMVVSVGPYYHNYSGLHRLSSMEHYKLVYLNSLRDRFKDEENNKTLKLMMRTIFDNEAKIRDSYADSTSHLSTHEFNKMVLIDTIFVIEFFRRCQVGEDGELTDELKDGKLFGRVWIHDIERDLLLLENQLPLFILDEIYNIAYKNPSGTLPAADFKSIVLKHFDMQGAPDWEQCNHLLDLVWRWYVPSTELTTSEHRNVSRIIASPTATSLHEAGVKLQSTDNHGLLLDISFDEEAGILTIPKLRVEDSTLSLFRNLIALEQCMYAFHTTTYVTDYFYFLDCLINTPQDVQLLADAGIVDNSLGCEFLCDMFNTISKNTHVAWWKYAYVDLSKQLNSHCQKRWNHHKATLKHKYFRHPWAAISVLSAGLLLVLTLAQVTTGILAVPGIL